MTNPTISHEPTNPRCRTIDFSFNRWPEPRICDALIWPLKYDVQLIGQSEDTKMRFHPKGGIEHRQYLRLKNVVASVRGFPRQGGLRVGQGKTCQTLNFSQCCAKSAANKRNSIRKGRENSRPVNFGATTRRRLSAETCRFSNPTVEKFSAPLTYPRDEGSAKRLGRQQMEG